MKTFTVTGTVPSAPAEVWRVMSDFKHGRFLGLPPDFYDAPSSNVGSVRRIVNKGTTVVERLVVCDHDKMTLAYEYDFEQGTSSFVGIIDFYLAQISLSADGSGTHVKYDCSYNWTGPSDGEDGWKAKMTGAYTSWIENAGQMAGALPAQYSLDNSGEVPIGIIRLDDGKANAFGFDFVSAFDSALDAAENDDSKAVVIIGNEKAFSAGFDLSVVASKDATQSAKDALLHGGGMLVTRVYGFKKPVVLAVTGHALALGAIMLFAGDVRIGPAEEGAPKPARIGMNEVAIGMTLPQFAIDLAKARIPVTELTKALTQAKVYGPEEAVFVGYLDMLAKSSDFDDVLDAAIEEARRLGGYVKQPAFARQKLLERAPTIEELERGMAEARDAQLRAAQLAGKARASRL